MTVTLIAGTGYRLPTEAEWEYACRAKTSTPFHFGTTLNGDAANVDGTVPYMTTKGVKLSRTATIGSYPKNDFGLFDMHGNVQEWCFDIYGPEAYSDRPKVTDNPIVTEGSPNRVVRGGAWNLKAANARAAHRNRNRPSDRQPDTGFRIVRSAMTSS